MEMTFPQFVPCGDRALLIYLGAQIDPELNRRVRTLADQLRGAHPAITEVTASYHAALVEYDPVRLRTEALIELIELAITSLGALPPAPGRTITIPVAYGGEHGPDLDRVAAVTGLTPDAVVEAHAGGAYTVYALGFSPGFPYLGGLNSALATPRLDSPRAQVPAGSVGIGGGQTGLYPQASPGGWNLIGRTPLRLFDAAKNPPTLLAPGDQVRFQPISEAQFEAMAAGERLTPSATPAPTPSEAHAGLRVLQPGLLTTIQDLGRRGYALYGVSPAGAVDFWSLMVGNWLLGNRARSAALEITVQGPELEVTGPLAFAITGAPIEATLYPADGSAPETLHPWHSYLAKPGDRISLGAVQHGCRSYLCLQGGIGLPPVLGSLSEDLFGKIGPLGRPLQAGDWLPLGLPLHAPAEIAGRALPPSHQPDWAAPAPGKVVTLRFVPGPQPFPAEALEALAGAPYSVTPTSDRQGIRLSGATLSHGPGGADILSEPIAPGSIQVPADGQPILLLGNRQTVAGYAKIGVVIYPDLARAGQLRPGDQVRFTPVTLAEAQAITRAERRRLAVIRRLLERGEGLAELPPRPEPAAPAPVAVAPEATPEPALPPVYTAAAPRVFRVSISGIEFTAEVEEVE
jgi:KipI family sensor histidine kinase inhibitor